MICVIQWFSIIDLTQEKHWYGVAFPLLSLRKELKSLESRGFHLFSLSDVRIQVRFEPLRPSIDIRFRIPRDFKWKWISNPLWTIRSLDFTKLCRFGFLCVNVYFFHFFPGGLGGNGTAQLTKKGFKGRRSSWCVSRYLFESVGAIIICGIRIDQLICQYGASWLQYLKNWFPITSCEEIAKEYREALWGVPGTGMEQPHTWEWGVDSWELRLTLKSEKWTCELSIDQHIRVFEADFSASKCLSESARFLGNPKPLSTDATPFQGSEHLIYINDSPQQIYANLLAWLKVGIFQREDLLISI